MIATTPEIDNEGRYTTTQAAAALQIHPKTLRRYAAARLIKFKTRKAGHKKVFLGRDLLALWRMTY